MLKKVLFTLAGLWMILGCVGCATNTPETPGPEDDTIQKKVFIVTFDTLGGTAIEQIKVEEGKELQLPVTPTKEGHTFEGWFTDKECTKPFSDLKISSNITLYAKWKQNEVSVPLANTKVFL